MADLGGTYVTGTISIDNADSVVVGSGTLWSVVAEVGDWLYADGSFALISEVTDDTHLALELPWAGADLSGSAYVLVKMSWLRYEPALTQQKIRALLAFLDATGTFYFVEGSEPDVGLGDDGQWALKVNSGAWKIWYKTGGVWVLQGSPVGFVWKSLWVVGTTYQLNDVVHRSGKAYISLVASNTGHDPVSSPTQWDLFTVGGSQYDLVIWDNGKSVSDEVIFRMTMVTPVQFPTNFASSRGDAETAPTADAVYNIKKNGVTFGTVVFPAGIAIPVFYCTATTFAAGDKLTVHAPNPADATLADVSLTLIAYT